MPKIIVPLFFTITFLLIFSPLRADDSKPLTLRYDGESTVLSTEQAGMLDNLILPSLQKDASSRLEIRGFAPADVRGQSTPRRLSLSRALAVAEHLKKAGIEDNRLLIFPMGGGVPDETENKVELRFSAK
ncbi:MAG: hypothetical protein IT559_05665 [Alphaproteobacteria bacterium]|nr:hypothetical protein [Alphaproteobacteria bacterium]